MRRQVQWVLGLVFLVAAAGLGCGRQNTSRSIDVSVPPPATPDEPTLPAPASPPVAELPSSPAPSPAPPQEAPPADEWWLRHPELEPMPVNVPACVSTGAPVGKRFAHPCTVKGFGPDGQLVTLQRLDADGNLLEDARRPLPDGHWDQQALCTYTALTTRCERTSGTYKTSTLDTYDPQGRQVRSESYEREQIQSFTEWRYDEAGHLTRICRGVSPTHCQSNEYVYDAQGRLTSGAQYQEDTALGEDNSTRQFHHWERYRYGARGELEAIEVSIEPDFESPYWDVNHSFTYHPNGQLWKDRDGLTFNMDYHRYLEYDDQGHLISTDSGGVNSGGVWTWTYNALGQREELDSKIEGSWVMGQTWQSWRYDAAGRLGLERSVQEMEVSVTSPSQIEHTFEFNRYTYACETGDLLSKAQDTNADGVRDGGSELERDAAGNLLVERLHGSLLKPGSPARVEYDYSCHP